MSTTTKPQTRAEKAAALRARAALLEQAEKKSARAADAKRKIVLGGTVLLLMETDDRLRAQVLSALREFTADRPADRRAVADLIGSDQPMANGQDHQQDRPA